MKQTAKIKELKGRIKEVELKIDDMFTNLDPKKEAELPEEEQNKNKEVFRDSLAILRTEKKALTEELKITRMNKTGSTFFEWHPHVGMSRSSARMFARLRAQGKLKNK